MILVHNDTRSWDGWKESSTRPHKLGCLPHMEVGRHFISFWSNLNSTMKDLLIPACLSYSLPYDPYTLASMWNNGSGLPLITDFLQDSERLPKRQWAYVQCHRPAFAPVRRLCVKPQHPSFHGTWTVAFTVKRQQKSNNQNHNSGSYHLRCTSSCKVS